MEIDEIESTKIDNIGESLELKASNLRNLLLRLAYNFSSLKINE
jgi:hypothetical protein